MTVVGLFGVLLGLLALPFAFVQHRRYQVILFLGLLLLHAVASVIYYWYAQSNPADSNLYYYPTKELLRLDISPGTIFTIHLVHFLKSTLGGTYLDHFLIFQAIGFWGVAFLLRTFDELALELKVRPSVLVWGVLFLPSTHFWTSAIGKDSPLFLGVSIAVWSTMRIKTRLPFLAFALLVMALFRPHVALIATISLALAAAFGRSTTTQAKAGLLILGLVGIAITANTVETSLQVDVSSPGSISSFVERQQAVNEEVGGGTSVRNASFPVRLLSLLFRPLFFDVNGPMALIASIENVFMIAFVIYTYRTKGGMVRIFREVYFFRFALFFTCILLLMLSFVYYNVGLGLRQRSMVLPALFSLFVTQYLVGRASPRTVIKPEPLPSESPISL